MKQMEIVKGSARKRNVNMYRFTELERLVKDLESRVKKLEKRKPRPKKEE